MGERDRSRSSKHWRRSSARRDRNDNVDNFRDDDGEASSCHERSGTRGREQQRSRPDHDDADGCRRETKGKGKGRGRTRRGYHTGRPDWGVQHWHPPPPAWQQPRPWTRAELPALPPIHVTPHGSTGNVGFTALPNVETAGPTLAFPGSAADDPLNGLIMVSYALMLQRQQRLWPGTI
eukprot:6472207-Amphidinium_carterae.1